MTETGAEVVVEGGTKALTGAGTFPF